MSHVSHKYVCTCSCSVCVFMCAYITGEQIRKRRCKAAFSYVPQHEDELELKIGDIIEIISEVRLIILYWTEPLRSVRKKIILQTTQMHMFLTYLSFFIMKYVGKKIHTFALHLLQIYD